MNKKVILPVINVRDVVFYPGSEHTLYFGRDFSIKALKHAKKKTRNHVVLVTQKSVTTEKPFGKNDTYSVGTICKVKQSVQLTDGSMKAIVRATQAVKIFNTKEIENIRYVIGHGLRSASSKNRVRRIDQNKKTEFLKLILRWKPEIAMNEDLTQFESLKNENDFGNFLNLALNISACPSLHFGTRGKKKLPAQVAKRINSGILVRQKILEEPNPSKRLSMLSSILRNELRWALLTAPLGT